MAALTPHNYGPAFAPLLATAPLNELGPGRPNTALREKLQNISVETAFAPLKIADRAMAQACLAGLWLRYDFLEESHHISQELPGTTGSYWHAIMHRREPDFGNAKYWFHRVGQHAVFPQICIAAREIVKAGVEPQRFDPTASFFLELSEWDPFHFIDLVESVAGEPSSIEKLCRKIQLREWELLFDFCYQKAIGSERES